MPTVVAEPKPRGWKTKALRGVVHLVAFCLLVNYLSGEFRILQDGARSTEPNLHPLTGAAFFLAANLLCGAFVYGVWLIGLMAADRRTRHIDPATRRRGERAELVMLLAFGAVFATAGIVVAVLWFLGK